MQSPHSKHTTNHRTFLQSQPFKCFRKILQKILQNYLLQRRGNVLEFNPYMNNKYVHIGHAQIFQLLLHRFDIYICQRTCLGETS